jgi:hypothetical protein
MSLSSITTTSSRGGETAAVRDSGDAANRSGWEDTAKRALVVGSITFGPDQLLAAGEASSPELPEQPWS